MPGFVAYQAIDGAWTSPRGHRVHGHICSDRSAADRSAEIAAEFVRELGDIGIERLEAATGPVTVNRAVSGSSRPPRLAEPPLSPQTDRASLSLRRSGAGPKAGNRTDRLRSWRFQARPSRHVAFDGKIFEFGAGELTRVPIENLRRIVKPPKLGRLNVDLPTRRGSTKNKTGAWVEAQHEAELNELVAAVQGVIGSEAE